MALGAGASSSDDSTLSPLRKYFRRNTSLRGTLRGLVAWWSAEGSAADPVGGHTGHAVNGVRYWPGKFGQAFLFNRGGAAVLFGDVPALKLEHSMTLSAWLSIWSVSDGGQIIFRGDNRGGLDPYTVAESRGPGGTPIVQFHIESLPVNGQQRVVSISALAPCQRFFHLATTLNDRTGAMNLYLDGRLAASAVVDERPFGDLNPSQAPGVALGNVQDPNAYNEPFRGLVDEVMVFSRALTPAEIRVLFSAGAAAGNAPRGGADILVFSRHGGGQQTVCSVESSGRDLRVLSEKDSGSADPAWSPDGNEILFSRQESKSWQIFRENADGSDAARLTNDDNDDYAPAWSPNARRIAFVSTRTGKPEVFTMNSDGSDTAQLTFDAAGDESPAWSPDGSRIVYVSSRDGRRQLYTMNSDGSYPLRLSSAPHDEMDPAWSPDGQRVAFVRQDQKGSSSLW
ncbi:MAG: hypothetical protein LC772_05825, partial [Chloroflexi bacterium]|nr:hypothetical protein [Chloroflexota bacterium]